MLNRLLSKLYCIGKLHCLYGARILMYWHVHCDSVRRISWHFAQCSELRKKSTFSLLLAFIALSYFLVTPVFGQPMEQSDYQTSQQRRQTQEEIKQFKQQVIQLDTQTQTGLGAKLQSLGITQPIPLITWDNNGNAIPSEEKSSPLPRIESTPLQSIKDNSSTTNTSNSPALNMYEQ